MPLAGDIKPSGLAHLGKSAISVVKREMIRLKPIHRRSTIRQVEILIAIVVDVPISGCHSAESPAKSGLQCHIGKCPITIVAVKEGPVLGEHGRFSTHSTLDHLRNIERRIGHKEVEPAVVVVVEKKGHESKQRSGHPCYCGRIGKRSVAIVVIQDIFSAIIHRVEVEPAVVIVVAPDYPDGRPPRRRLQPPQLVP